MRKQISKLLILTALVMALIIPFAQWPASALDYKITYHGGPVIHEPLNVYMIFYGDWEGNDAPGILIEFVANLGGSPYAMINTNYPSAADVAPSGVIFYAGSIKDSYSRGKDLSEEDVAEIVTDHAKKFELPIDVNGIYLVLTSSEVTTTGFCEGQCEFSDFVTVFGIALKYAFIGNAERCPNKCARQFFAKGRFIETPNGNLGADAMANWIAHVINEAVTNPLGNGWYDLKGKTNSDKCVKTFGSIYRAANGAPANMQLGPRDFLIQQNWVNVDGGYCGLSNP